MIKAGTAHLSRRRPTGARAAWLLVPALALVGLALPAGPASAAKPKPPSSSGTDDSTVTTEPAPSPACGAQQSVTAVFYNSGGTTWTTGTYQLSAVPIGSTTWGPSTVALSTSVAPGASATFTWTPTTPSTSGTFPFTWQMEDGSTLFGAQTTVSVTTTCTIGDLFAGTKQFVADPTFNIPAATFENLGRPGHSDTATVDRGPLWTGTDRYLLFYRTFQNPAWVSNNYGIPAGIAVAYSSDGNSWTPYNNGAPVLPDRPASGTSCSPDLAICVVATYAPSVVMEPNGSFTMAYEVMDTSVAGGGSQPRNWIEAATSTDGYSWTSLTQHNGSVAKVLTASVAWEGLTASGQNVGNVGTPDLHETSSGYTVGYHGFDGTYFRRGMASGSNLLRLTRASSNPQFLPSPGWEATGPGKAADTTEGAYTYRIFEAFNGPAGCVRNDTEVGWGLARSTDGGVTWSYSGVDPIRTDRVGYSCGEDMPSWQVINARPMVLATRIYDVPANQANVRRYSIAAAPDITTSATIIGLAQPDASTANGGLGGYWEADSAGGISSFGGAPPHPAVSAGGASFVGVSAKPDGSGLWLVTKAGVVVGSDVAPLGNAVLTGYQAAIGIESDPAGDGYWVLVSDGTVQALGKAPALSPASASPALVASPAAIVRTPPTSTGQGFWILDQAGNVASYGSAPILSRPTITLTATAVGLGVRPDGTGGWVADANGRIYLVGASSTSSYGDTTSSVAPNGYQPFSHFAIAGISKRSVGSGSAVSSSGPDPQSGYYLVAGDGGVVDFGAAPYEGHLRGSGSAT